MTTCDVDERLENLYTETLAKRTGYKANWNNQRGWEFEKGDVHVWECRRGWAKANRIKDNAGTFYRNHRYFDTVEEALTAHRDSMDILNYHDVVKIVEFHRPHSVKMVQTEEMSILEPVLNKIRFALRELRKTKKKGI